jgi:hypothetical protein
MTTLSAQGVDFPRNPLLLSDRLAGWRLCALA